MMLRQTVRFVASTGILREKYLQLFGAMTFVLLLLSSRWRSTLSFTSSTRPVCVSPSSLKVKYHVPPGARPTKLSNVPGPSGGIGF